MIYIFLCLQYVHVSITDKIKIFNIYELSILIQNKMGSRNILVKYFSILFCVCKTKTAFVSFLNIFGRGEV